ncbi:MAG: hypothetical protein M0Z68_00905 [Gammaproteobacteria bacterium]|nr:hypothetical protein [Gammaproteobacteria bacterium]
MHGREAVIMFSAEAYRKLTDRRGSLVTFFQNSSLRGVDLGISRSRGTGRDILS